MLVERLSFLSVDKLRPTYSEDATNSAMLGLRFSVVDKAELNSRELGDTGGTSVEVCKVRDKLLCENMDHNK